MLTIKEIFELNQTLKEIKASNTLFPIVFAKLLNDNLNLTEETIRDNKLLNEDFSLRYLYWKDIRTCQDLRNISLNMMMLEKLKIILK